MAPGTERIWSPGDVKLQHANLPLATATCRHASQLDLVVQNAGFLSFLTRPTNFGLADDLTR